MVHAAQEAWGADMPDWVLCLAQECQSTSQVKAATKINRSGSLVNQVLKNRYKGDLRAVEDCVRGVFMNGTITCPALGSIPLNECRDWRNKSRRFVNVNSLRVRMYRACSSCPVNRKEV
jgi:hypothetical protein